MRGLRNFVEFGVRFPDCLPLFNGVSYGSPVPLTRWVAVRSLYSFQPFLHEEAGLERPGFEAELFSEPGLHFASDSLTSS
jgi:hypothetical protein